MKLLILSTNKQRDENIFPVIQVLHEKFGVTSDYIITNDFHTNRKPHYINELLKVEASFGGRKSALDATENGYKRRFRNLALLKSFFTKELLSHYDALLVGGDDYLGRYFMKKFRGKERFLIQDGLFFNVTSRLIYKEIIKEKNEKSLATYLFYLKYLTKESFIKIFKLLDVSYMFFSYSGKSEFDLFFISGAYTKTLLINEGVSDSRSLISGIPRFKYLFQNTPVNKHKEQPFDKAKKAITFMTGAYKNHSHFEMDICEKKFLKELCKRSERLKSYVQLYIKIHPRDSISDFEQFEKFDFVTLIDDVPIDRVLLESDIVMANASTTTVEAAFMDTPVIITHVSFIQTFKFSSYYGNDKNYYCVAETWEELDDYIVKILNDHEYKKEVITKQRKLTESLICSETQRSEIIIANEVYRRVTKSE